MPCDDYRPLVSQRAEGPLPEEQERLLEDHIKTCEGCRKAVALQRLDDTAVHSALLGLQGDRASKAAGTRRLTRVIVVPAVFLGLILFSLWALYGSFQRAAADKEVYRQAAAALDRRVLPRSLRRTLPVLLADFSDQIGAPVELAEDSTPPDEVTFLLERSVRLRSALQILAHFHPVKFVVGDDRVRFPTELEDSRSIRPESRRLEERLRDERVTLAYSGDRLEGALAFIDDLKGLNLVVAPDSVATVAETPARLEVRGETLGKVLDGLLRGTGLGWTVRHECVVIATP